MKDKTLDWLGGFFDGEGCVSLVPDSPKSGGKGWQGNVSVTQKDRAVLRRIQSQWGGCLYSKGDKNHDASNLRWNGGEALRMAKLLVTVCDCKWEQLELFISAMSRESSARGFFCSRLKEAKKEVCLV